jgi:hypothetical protein
VAFAADDATSATTDTATTATSFADALASVNAWRKLYNEERQAGQLRALKGRRTAAPRHRTGLAVGRQALAPPVVRRPGRHRVSPRRNRARSRPGGKTASRQAAR